MSKVSALRTYRKFLLHAEKDGGYLGVDLVADPPQLFHTRNRAEVADVPLYFVPLCQAPPDPAPTTVDENPLHTVLPVFAYLLCFDHPDTGDVYMLRDVPLLPNEMNSLRPQQIANRTPVFARYRDLGRITDLARFQVGVSSTAASFSLTFPTTRSAQLTSARCMLGYAGSFKQLEGLAPVLDLFSPEAP